MPRTAATPGTMPVAEVVARPSCSRAASVAAATHRPHAQPKRGHRAEAMGERIHSPQGGSGHRVPPLTGSCSTQPRKNHRRLRPPIAPPAKCPGAPRPQVTREGPRQPAATDHDPTATREESGPGMAGSSLGGRGSGHSTHGSGSSSRLDEYLRRPQGSEQGKEESGWRREKRDGGRGRRGGAAAAAAGSSDDGGQLGLPVGSGGAVAWSPPVPPLLRRRGGLSPLELNVT
ncbi:unnamed protein product [Urochloa humidicola]